MILEGAGEQPQPQTKQAEITAVLTVQPLHPLIAHGTDAQIDDPQIRQAGSNQQPTEPGGVAEMAFMDLKAATFQVREKGLDMWAQFVQLQGQIEIRHIRDQIDRFLVLRLPDRQDADQTVLLGGQRGRTHREQLAARRPQITDVERHTAGAEQEVGSRAADVLPLSVAQVGLQFGAVKLTIAQEGHSRALWHDLLDLREQLLMHGHTQMTFGPANDYPAERQGTPVIDHTQHQGNAAAPDHTAVDHQLDRLCRQRLQQLLRHRQKPAVDRLAVVFEPAAKAIDDTLLFGATAGGMVGDRGQVRVSPASQPTDQGHQGIQLLLALSARAWLIELHDRALYGTIPSIRVAQGGFS